RGADAELGTHGVPESVVSLAHDRRGSDRRVARPRDDEAPVRARGHGGKELVVGRVRVDPELRAQRVAAGVPAAAEDAGGAAVLAGALPDDDEASILGRRDERKELAGRGVDVDLE